MCVCVYVPLPVPRVGGRVDEESPFGADSFAAQKSSESLRFTDLTGGMRSAVGG